MAPWRYSGVANNEIWCQEAPKGVQREAKEPKSGPKEAQSGSKDGQRTALGGQKAAQGGPREAFWSQNWSKNAIFMHFWITCDFVKILPFTK